MKTAVKVLVLAAGLYAGSLVADLALLVVCALVGERWHGNSLTLLLAALFAAYLLVGVTAAALFWRWLAPWVPAAGARLALTAGFLLLLLLTLVGWGFVTLLAFNR